MIDISSLEQYFPQINNPLYIDKYRFTISFQQEDDTFHINLKIKQQDVKTEHLIKFRFGIGKDKPNEFASHKTHKPHFEIDIYKREKDSFSATLYFTFQDIDDKTVLDYAKGTIVLITRIVKNFFEHKKLDEKLINKLIFEQPVIEELGKFEPKLIEALYQCFKNRDLIVREPGKVTVIKTAHNIQKYLQIQDLQPLLLPLLDKIKENK